MMKHIGPGKVPRFATCFYLTLYLHVADISIVVSDYAVIPGV